MNTSVFRRSALASKLVTAEQLEFALRLCRFRLQQQGQPADAPIPDKMLAAVLVEQGIVTSYQAEQLMAGRTKFELGSYVIVDFIGQGGMGQVFKGIHKVMGRHCAVKILPRSRATEESQLAFLREIRVQAQLDCPYLVRAFDAGRQGRILYLVTEYVPGMDLRRMVKKRGPLPVPLAARIIMQAALGLEYAHRQGILHRDVKPGNILVTPRWEAKVSDVGLAGFLHDLFDDPRAGKIVGTADYISPEQIRTPLQLQPGSDIYSLGCTLYYTVCGKVPFPGGNTESKMERHLKEFPIHPRKFVPEIPDEFVDVIVDMMEKDVDKRIASAAEVAARLEPWANMPLQGDETEPQAVWEATLMDYPDASGDVAADEAEVAQAGVAIGQAAFMSTQDDMNQNTELEIARRQRTDHSSGSGFSGHSLPPIESVIRPRRSNAVIVAITIAVVLPIALLIGAILGFLLARTM